jgi:hypothetical protein
MSIWTASDGLPLDANRLPFRIIPSAFRKKALFLSAKATSSSACALALV